VRLTFESEEDDPVHVQEKINMDTLLKTESVNELTSAFVEKLREQLSKIEKTEDLGLYRWLQGVMFEASGRALLGDKVFEHYPAFGEEFWDFDSHMLSLFFGIPEFLLPEAVKFRERSIGGLMRWHKVMAQKGLDKTTHSASDVPWEPNYGSRANRARQEMYSKLDLSLRARAGLDLGFTFALASNAIPATGWMLMHILDPTAAPLLLPRVMAELRSAQLPDGTLDINTLVSLPLLQSIFHEVLRLYTDVLVTRTLLADLSLPVDSANNRHIALHKGSLAIAPSWLGQRDPTVWKGPPHNVFYPERFLAADPETGRDVFTTKGTAGRFFPFGGGKGICPGRVFAKQEILAATALVLLGFEFERKGFVDAKGRETKKFPGLKDGYGGSGIVVHAGDIVVEIKKRQVFGKDLGWLKKSRRMP